MSAQFSAWLVTLAFAGAMVSFGMSFGVLAKPTIWSRCGACSRLYRRGRVCRCTQRHDA